MPSSILLTGSSGKLGSAIRSSGIFPSLLTPTRKELDITDKRSIGDYFSKNKISTIIHLAAIARMKICEQDPSLAITTNIIGTSNLVNQAIIEEQKRKRSIRFIYLSTDGVYEGVKGNYLEKDPALPYNTYGHTKLGAECAVRALKDHLIIRTSFFDPKNIPFDTAPNDMISSKMEINDLIRAIKLLSNSGLIGTINVGEKPSSEYDRYKEFKKGIRKTSFKKVQDQAGFPLAKDASLNLSKWDRIKGSLKTEAKKIKK